MAQADTANNAAPNIAEGTKPRLLGAADVTSLIEHERAGLMQIEGILKCLYEILLYADDDDSTMHADVANVCARLINESVGRLESLLMRRRECNGTTESSQSVASESDGSEE